MSSDKKEEKTSSDKEIASEKVKNDTKPVIRKQNDIDALVQEVGEYWDRKDNLVEKLFTGDRTFDNFQKWVLISITFLVLAFAGSFIIVDPFSASIENFRNSGFLNFSNTGAGVDFFFMPIFLFVHMLIFAAITKGIKEAFTAVPAVMDVPMDDFTASINKIQSNFWVFLFAAPFIIYDTIFANPWYAVDVDVFFSDWRNLNFPMVIKTPNYDYIGLIPDTILFFSWIIEWLIFGALIYMLIAYMRYINRITKQYRYDSQLLSIVLKGQLEPLIKLGYKLSIALGAFLILNIAYTFWTGFWYSDTIAMVIIFLLLPIVSIVPMRAIEHDLQEEQTEYINSATDDILSNGMAVLIDASRVSLEDKVNIIVKDRMLQKFDSLHKDTIGIYIRIFLTLGISLAGILWNYRAQVSEFIAEFGVFV